MKSDSPFLFLNSKLKLDYFEVLKHCQGHKIKKRIKETTFLKK